MQPLVLFTQGGLFIECKIQINKFAFVMCESSFTVDGPSVKVQGEWMIVLLPCPVKCACIQYQWLMCKWVNWEKKQVFIFLKERDCFSGCLNCLKDCYCKFIPLAVHSASCRNRLDEMCYWQVRVNCIFVVLYIDLAVLNILIITLLRWCRKISWFRYFLGICTSSGFRQVLYFS